MIFTKKLWNNSNFIIKKVFRRYIRFYSKAARKFHGAKQRAAHKNVAASKRIQPIRASRHQGAMPRGDPAALQHQTTHHIVAQHGALSERGP